MLAYYELKFPSQRIFDEPAIMSALPRELRRKLMLELFDDMMQVCNMAHLYVLHDLLICVS